MKPKAFATEADLCSSFLVWVVREHPEVRAFSEWAGWDILLVYTQGFQVTLDPEDQVVVPMAEADTRWGPYVMVGPVSICFHDAAHMRAFAMSLLAAAEKMALDVAE